jgi:hypothetical protein
LKYPIIANRIKGYLDDEQFITEFNHTILHK